MARLNLAILLKTRLRSTAKKVLDINHSTKHGKAGPCRTLCTEKDVRIRYTYEMTRVAINSFGRICPFWSCICGGWLFYVSLFEFDDR